MSHCPFTRLLDLMVVSGAMICAGGCAHGGVSRSSLDQMVASERAFCRMARETSVKQAFLHYLSDDAVMLLPRPANGKQYYNARPLSDAGLHWEPSVACISASGDLGYTYGPWEYRRHRDQDTADEYGHFVSVWQKQSDGRWRLVFDSGISHPRPGETKVALRVNTTGAMNTAVHLNTDEQQGLADSLLALDRDLSDTVTSAVVQTKMISVLGKQTSLFEESQFPVLGKNAVKARLQAGTAAYQWLPQKAMVASSGDLGYVYGMAQMLSPGKTTAEIAYLRIWERGTNGKWRIVVQKTNPVTE